MQFVIVDVGWKIELPEGAKTILRGLRNRIARSKILSAMR